MDLKIESNSSATLEVSESSNWLYFNGGRLQSLKMVSKLSIRNMKKSLKKEENQPSTATTDRRA